MKLRRLVLGGAALVTLAGCQHFIETRVQVYQPAQRATELAQRKAAAAENEPVSALEKFFGGVPEGTLSFEEEATLRQLEAYFTERPKPVAEPYPTASFLWIQDIVEQHRPWAERATATYRKSLVRAIVEPTRTELQAQRTEFAKNKTALEALESELAALEAADRSNVARSRRAELTDEIDGKKAELSEAEPVIADNEKKLAELQQSVAASVDAYEQPLLHAIATAHSDLNAVRSSYLHEGISSKIYGEQVQIILANFFSRFLADLALKNAGSDPDVLKDLLALDLSVPPDLQAVYSVGPSASIRELVPSSLAKGAMGSASATDLAVRAAPASGPKDGVIRRDLFSASVTDPIMSIADQDPDGWVSTPSLVLHQSNSKADILIIRESTGQYHATALKDTASTTTNATARFALASASVVLEAAQQFGGLNLGLTLPVGAGSDPEAIKAAIAKTPAFSPEGLRSLARVRLERTQSLLERFSTVSGTPAEAAWSAEARALLESHPKLSSDATPANPPATSAAETDSP